MENNHDVDQLELFAQAGRRNHSPEGRIPVNLRSFIKNYEKALVSIICAIVIAIVSFSLGVKRGRQGASLQDATARPDIAATRRTDAQPPRTLLKEKTKEEKVPVVEEKPVEVIVEEDNYTIQVASFKTSSRAEKEADNLRKNGYTVITDTKGQYVVVYVGKFSTKENARSLLSLLKKRYSDCFIRRL